MEDVLSATSLLDALTALRAFIDNIDISTGLAPGVGGADSGRRAPDPMSQEGKELAARHLRVLASCFEALDRGGFVINIAKCHFLRRSFKSSMGMVGDGVQRRIDPERLTQWDSFSVPAAPSLSGWGAWSV